MKEIFQDYLFDKHYLVNEQPENSSNAFELLVSLAKLFGIRIVKGAELLSAEHIPYVSSRLGRDVPAAFYRGFPESVRRLSPDKRLYDQALHYYRTYGMGDFSEAGHSVMEQCLERTAFNEETEAKEFSVISGEEGVQMVIRDAAAMLEASRPLSYQSFELLCAAIEEYGLQPTRCASKNTAMRLLLRFRDLRYAEFLWLSDVIKLTELLCYQEYGQKNIRSLNLRNRDRKLLTQLLDLLLESDREDIENCYVKRALWCGLLHHLHYKPACDLGRHFLWCMREGPRRSIYSTFEKYIKDGKAPFGTFMLRREKGSGAVLRSLNYILSRCKDDEQVRLVLHMTDAKKPLLLLQLLMSYSYPDTGRRTFSFTRFNKLVVHRETNDEMSRRRSFVPEAVRERVCAWLREKLGELCRGRLGRVYIDEDMKRSALPLQENATMGGFGVLPKGSILPIPKGKIIRAFTYWEKVNDIDLAAISINRDGTQSEFSWRTMSMRDTKGIVYSGDQTSGFNGGSEYFDIDPRVLSEEYPDMRYLVFTNCVYSRSPFSKCLCKAGYMLRDSLSSGEVFEPKTVQSSFAINCESTFAYLFAIDLEKSDFIWLNIAREGSINIAGKTAASFLQRYFHATSVMSLYDYFALLASEVVADPQEAEVIVSDRIAECEGGGEIIRSYDFPRIMELLE